MKRILKNQLILFIFCLLGSICLLWIPLIGSAEESAEPEEELLIDPEDEEWLEEETKEPFKNIPVQESAPAKLNTETSETSDASESSEVNETDKAEEDNGKALEQELDSPAKESLFSTSVDPYEQELHIIYKQHYHQKISQTEWQKIVNQVSGDIYTVKANDTLWDISKMLFGDPYYWPKLWSVNANIGNPHLIQPGYNLGFVHGTASLPPSISLVDTKIHKQAEPIRKPVINFLTGKKIKIPAPIKHRSPIMYNIPSSLPQISMSKEVKDKLDMSNIKVQFGKLNATAKSFLGYFMSADSVDSLQKGVVLRKKDNDGVWSHTTEVVILKLDDFMHAGHLLTVVKDLGKLSSLPSGVRGPTGYQVEVQGEVKVIGRVPDSEDLYEARVTKAINPVSNGSILVDNTLPEFNFHRTDIFGSGSAQIIGFPSIIRTQETGGPYDFVYLNRGSENGFAVGQMYQVKANKNIRQHFPYGYDIQLGELKIIYAEERFATAIVTGLKHPIHIGDYVVSQHGVVTGSEHPSVLEEEDLIEEDWEDRPDEMLKQTPAELPEDVEAIDDDDEEDLDEIFDRSTVETTEEPLSATELKKDEIDIEDDEDWGDEDMEEIKKVQKPEGESLMDKEEDDFE